MQESNFGWVAWILTVLTWVVAYSLNFLTRKKNNINSSIDEFRQTVKQLEERSLSFWLDQHASVHEYQITIGFKRLSFLATELQSLDRTLNRPDDKITELRQATLLYNSRNPQDQRPINPKSQRANEPKKSWLTRMIFIHITEKFNTHLFCQLQSL